MILFSREFLDWFETIDWHDMTSKEIAWEAFREGQKKVVKSVVSEMVDMSGNVAQMKLVTTRTADELSLRLATMIERTQYFGSK